MLALFAPTVAQTQAFIAAQTPLPFSYPGVGSTRQATAPPGFNHDFNTIELGQGEAVWAAAKAAVRQWRMFPAAWTNIYPANTPIRVGEVVAMTARVLGIWWLNSCRIVYVLDNDQQFGFAYGTLPGHVERGEELFLVEQLDDGRVIYSVRAFSQPRHWLARLGYPLARAYQRKFVRDSKAAVLDAVRSA